MVIASQAAAGESPSRHTVKSVSGPKPDVPRPRTADCSRASSPGLSYNFTSSSAVAKRPRDASCLSVVSFNSTKRRVESFIVSYVGYRYCHGVQLSTLFCCLWRNVEVSCHKHFVVFSGNQHCCLLSAMCHNLRHAGRAPPATALTTPACCSVNTGSQARYRLRIAISAYRTCIRRRGVPVGTEKLEWCSYPTVKKV